MKMMEEFMEHTIQDLYSAEKQALEAMPQLMQRVQNDQLRQAFQTHQRETEQQVQRLEQIAQQLGIDPDGETCMAMQGLIEEAQDLLSQLEDGQLADAAIIGAAQKMEHYEIAAYGQLGHLLSNQDRIRRPTSSNKHCRKRNQQIKS